MPNKKIFTRTVCRTGYGHRNISVSLPADATEDEIKDAILDESPQHEFNEHSADYTLVDTICNGDERVQRAMCELMSMLNSIGFGRDVSINGADAVDAVAQAYEDALSSLSGSPISPMVIHSPSENGYWSNDDGWGDMAGATHVFDHGVRMPMSADNDARLTFLSDVRARAET